MTNVDFGVRVQKAREARGLKASDLARLVGVTPTAVWNWENKGRRPHADTLKAVAKVLGRSEEFFRSGEEGPADPKMPLQEILDWAAVEIASTLDVGREQVKVRFEIASA
jgi:transcriptional regulator with XRE-family HTH domain